MTIFTHSSSDPHHILCQGSIASILTSLCDDEISMIETESEKWNLQQLICSIPLAEELKRICEALVKHVKAKESEFISVIPSIRVLCVLIEHDLGLKCVKTALEQDSECIFTLLERLQSEFKNNSDCLTLFSTTVEFLKRLIAMPKQNSQIPDAIPKGNSQFPEVSLRTQNLRLSFVKSMLKWNSDAASKTSHPLVKLCDLAKSNSTEDASLTPSQ